MDVLQAIKSGRLGTFEGTVTDIKPDGTKVVHKFGPLFEGSAPAAAPGAGKPETLTLRETIALLGEKAKAARKDANAAAREAKERQAFLKDILKHLKDPENLSKMTKEEFDQLNKIVQSSGSGGQRKKWAEISKTFEKGFAPKEAVVAKKSLGMSDEFAQKYYAWKEQKGLSRKGNHSGLIDTMKEAEGKMKGEIPMAKFPEKAVKSPKTAAISVDAAMTQGIMRSAAAENAGNNPALNRALGNLERRLSGTAPKPIEPTLVSSAVAFGPEKLNTHDLIALNKLATEKGTVEEAAKVSEALAQRVKTEGIKAVEAVEATAKKRLGMSDEFAQKYYAWKQKNGLSRKGNHSGLIDALEDAKAKRMGKMPMATFAENIVKKPVGGINPPIGGTIPPVGGGTPVPPVGGGTPIITVVGGGGTVPPAGEVASKCKLGRGGKAALIALGVVALAVLGSWLFTRKKDDAVKSEDEVITTILPPTDEIKEDENIVPPQGDEGVVIPPSEEEEEENLPQPVYQGNYEVVRGDCLWTIAKKQLEEINDCELPDAPISANRENIALIRNRVEQIIAQNNLHWEPDHYHVLIVPGQVLDISY